MVRCFFLLIHFLKVEDCELPTSTNHIQVISSEFCLDPPLFSPTLIVSLMMFCESAGLLSELMIMLSTHHVTNHLKTWFLINKL